MTDTPSNTELEQLISGLVRVCDISDDLIQDRLEEWADDLRERYGDDAFAEVLAKVHYGLCREAGDAEQVAKEAAQAAKECDAVVDAILDQPGWAQLIDKVRSGDQTAQAAF
jgi:hypothetical protein